MAQSFEKQLKRFSLKIQKNFYFKSTFSAVFSLSLLTFFASASCLLAGISEFFALPSILIFDFFSLYTAAVIAYNAAPDPADRFIPAVLSLLSFCVLIPFEKDISWFGLPGYFSAVIVGFLSVKIYSKLSGLDPVFKLPGNIPSSVFDTYISYIPIIFTAAIFIALRFLFSFTAAGHIVYYIFTFIQRPILYIAGSPLMLISILLLIQILWYYGMHGSLSVMPIYVPLFTALSIENLSLIRDGLAPVNMLNSAFFWIYAFPGGSGATLGLALLMFFFSRSKKMKEIIKTSFLPNLLAINEPIVMGLPMAYNPKIALPFIFVPLINALLAALFTGMGVLPILNGIYLPFTTPFFIYGFISGGLRVVLFQIALILLDILIYLPFFLVIDRDELRKES